jgi:lysophospholipase L1-like esterase
VKKHAQRALAVMLSVFLAIGLMEIALRIALPARKKFYVWPPSTVQLTNPDPKHMPGVSGPARFTVNAVGARGRELGPEPEHRILAVGGSTTECAYLDDGETWTALVAAALPRTADGRPVWIGNIGKSGHTSRDHVVQLKRYAPQIPKLDTVTVLVGVNDVTSTLAQDPWPTPAPITDAAAERQQFRKAFVITPGRIQDAGFDEPAYKHTVLYQMAKRVSARLASRRATRGLAQDEFGAVYGTWREHRRGGRIRDRAPDLAGPLAEYRRNLETLADLAAARSLRLVLITQPTLWRADLSKAELDLLWLGGVGDFQQEPGHDYYSAAVLAETMARFNDVLLDVCRARNLPCLDLAAKLPKNTTIFYDDCHYTEAGSGVVAEIVAAHLRALPPFAR